MVSASQFEADKHRVNDAHQVPGSFKLDFVIRPLYPVAPVEYGWSSKWVCASFSAAKPCRNAALQVSFNAPVYSYTLN